MDGLVAWVAEGSESLESDARGEEVVFVEVEDGDDDRLASSSTTSSVRTSSRPTGWPN